MRQGEMKWIGPNMRVARRQLFNHEQGAAEGRDSSITSSFQYMVGREMKWTVTSQPRSADGCGSKIGIPHGTPVRKHGPKLAVSWHFNFDPYPDVARFGKTCAHVSRTLAGRPSRDRYSCGLGRAAKSQNEQSFPRRQGPDPRLVYHLHPGKERPYVYRQRSLACLKSSLALISAKQPHSQVCPFEQ